jgi:hypothetical protein
MNITEALKDSLQHADRAESIRIIERWIAERDAELSASDKE